MVSKHKEINTIINLTIIDFIKIYNNEMSVRLANNLKLYAQYYKFVEDLNRTRFRATPAVGKKTIMELDSILKKNNIDLYFYLRDKDKKWYYNTHMKRYVEIIVN